MGWFTDGLVPVIYVVCGATFASALATLRFPSAYRVLLVAVTVSWIAVAGQAVGGVVVLLSGEGPFSLVTALGYLIVAPAILPLFGIGRLARPPAPGERRDPEAPVLTPRQIEKVDAIAALIVSAALAVVAWRLTDVLGPAG